MTKKEVIVNHPLELSLPTKETKALRKIIKKANESYVIDCKETLGVKVGNLQYYNFEICCPMTNFANAYHHFGILYAQEVLPIWKNRCQSPILKNGLKS